MEELELDSSFGSEDEQEEDTVEVPLDDDQQGGERRPRRESKAKGKGKEKVATKVKRWGRGAPGVISESAHSLAKLKKRLGEKLNAGSSVTVDEKLQKRIDAYHVLEKEYHKLMFAVKKIIKYYRKLEKILKTFSSAFHSISEHETGNQHEIACHGDLNATFADSIENFLVALETMHSEITYHVAAELASFRAEFRRYTDKRLEYDIHRLAYEKLKDPASPKLPVIEDKFLHAYNDYCHAKVALCDRMDKFDEQRLATVRTQLTSLLDAIATLSGTRQAAVAETIVKLKQVGPIEVGLGSGLAEPALPGTSSHHHFNHNHKSHINNHHQQHNGNDRHHYASNTSINISTADTSFASSRHATMDSVLNQTISNNGLGSGLGGDRGQGSRTPTADMLLTTPGSGSSAGLNGSNSRLDQTSSTTNTSQFFTPYVNRLAPTALHAPTQDDDDNNSMQNPSLSLPQRGGEKEDVTAYSGDSEGESADPRKGSVSSSGRGAVTSTANRMNSIDIDIDAD